MAKTLQREIITFEVTEKEIDKLFENSGKTMIKTMIDIRTVKRSQTRNTNLQATNLSELLHHFLSEIIYLKETYNLIFSEINVSINEQTFALSGFLKGESFDKSRHAPKITLKSFPEDAVRLTKNGNLWQASISFIPDRRQ